MRSARSNMTSTWLLGNARIAMESGATSLPWRPSGGCGANGRRQKPRGRRQRLSGRQRRQRLRGRRRRQPPAPFGPLAGTPARARLRPRRHSAARLARRRRACPARCVCTTMLGRASASPPRRAEQTRQAAAPVCRGESQPRRPCAMICVHDEKA